MFYQEELRGRGIEKLQHKFPVALTDICTVITDRTMIYPIHMLIAASEGSE
jgi:hypothetical protein